jgi:hypothetical protein
MFPHERSLVKRLADKPFALLGVNSDKDLDELKKQNEKEQITWRSFYDGPTTSGPIATAWVVEGWPTLYLLDSKGVIRQRFDGRPEEDILDKAIDDLLKEAAQK